jgi:hypothetical protein
LTNTADLALQPAQADARCTMMPSRVSTGKSRSGASSKVACGCIVATLLLGSLLAVLLLSSASIQAKQARISHAYVTVPCLRGCNTFRLEADGVSL